MQSTAKPMGEWGKFKVMSNCIRYAAVLNGLVLNVLFNIASFQLTTRWNIIVGEKMAAVSVIWERNDYLYGEWLVFRENHVATMSRLMSCWKPQISWALSIQADSPTIYFLLNSPYCSVVDCFTPTLLSSNFYYILPGDSQLILLYIWAKMHFEEKWLILLPNLPIYLHFCPHRPPFLLLEWKGSYLRLLPSLVLSISSVCIFSRTLYLVSSPFFSATPVFLSLTMIMAACEKVLQNQLLQSSFHQAAWFLSSSVSSKPLIAVCA